MKTEGQRMPQRQRTLICDSVTSLGCIVLVLQTAVLLEDHY